MQNKEQDGLEAVFTMETGGGNVIESVPFRVLVFGDWAGDGEREGFSARKPVVIDRDEFDAVMSGYRARLVLEIGSGAIEIEFNELDDFHPDEIYRRLPVFAELRDLRKRLSDDATFYQAAREVREKFNISDTAENDDAGFADAPAAHDSNDLLSSILEKPSGGAPVRAKADTDLGRLISDLVRPYLVSVDDTEKSGYLSAVDTAIGDLMRSIIQHPKFKQLEAAWRSLFLLVRRVETSNELKLFVFDCTKDEIADDLRQVDDLESSTVFRLLVSDAKEPWAFTAGNFTFAPTVDDIAFLMRMSKISATANAPFISSVSPELLGIESLAEESDPRQWTLNTGDQSAVLWAALADQPESVFLGSTVQRYLARQPYGAETDPTESFAFEEIVDEPKHEDHLWANSGMLVAYLLAATFSDHGWEMSRKLKQDIDGLPLHIYSMNGETEIKPCGEVLLSDRAADIVIGKGLMPVLTFRGTGNVKIGIIQSIAGSALKGRWS